MATTSFRRWALTGLLATGVSALALSLSIDIEPAASGDGVSTDAASIVADGLWGRKSLCSGRNKGASNMALRVRFARTYAAAADGATEADAPEVPLYEGLGDFSYPISTDVPEAQAYFDQGLKLHYNFNHYEARRSFQAAQAADPHCAICAWGEAFVLGPNINAPMAADAVGPAFDAISRARALADNASAKERALIAALAERYSPDIGADRAALDAAFAEAMLTLSRVYNDDDHILALTAEAIMDTQPWDYWNEDNTPKGQADQAIALVETVLERNPNHAAAIHLYIHLTEASDSPERAEAHAERLAALVPAAGHLVHMPSHTYFVIGRYKDSLETNIKAVEADEAFLAQSDEYGFVRYGYYPHNVHFVLVSAQAMGDKTTALANADKLTGLVPEEIMQAAYWTRAIAVAPLMAKVQFAAHDAVLAEADPGDAFPFRQGHWHYARGAAHAAKGQFDAARAEADAIARIAAQDGPDIEELETGGLPVRPVLQIAESVLRGRIARAEGDLAAAVAHFKKAAEAQAALPYLEPPFWYYPAAQSLGAAHLEAGDLEAAERAFRQALVAFPDNGWSLYGLMTTYERMGKPAVADRIEAQFEAAWAGAEPPRIADL